MHWLVGGMAVSPEAWSAVAAGISALIALVAAVAAVRQVDASRKQVTLSKQQTAIANAQKEAADQQLRATAWSTVAQLDATLRGYADERKWVNEQAKKPKKDQEQGPDSRDITGYMGVFERLDELLETGLVNRKTAHALYGSRLRELLKTVRARNMLDGSPGGWTSFISLSLRLDDYGRKKSKAVIVVPGPNVGYQMKPDEDYRATLEAALYKLARVGDLDAAARLDGLAVQPGAQDAASRPDGLVARRGDLNGRQDQASVERTY